MELIHMKFEPNTKYEAVGQCNMGIGITTISGIKLKTDKNGELVKFSDGLLRGKLGRRLKEDVNGAKIYDYLELKNLKTGKILNLKLHTAAAKGDLYLAKQALSEKHDINLRMKQGATPLHWAAAHGRLEIAKLFVEHNADIDIEDDWGWTPILLAANHGHPDVVGYLKKSGAKLSGVVNGEELFVKFDGENSVQVVEYSNASMDDNTKDVDIQGIENKVIEIASELYSEPPGYNPVSIDTPLGISGLGAPKDEFLQEIEDEFDLYFPDEEAEKLKTVGMVLEYVIAVISA